MLLPPLRVVRTNSASASDPECGGGHRSSPERREHWSASAHTPLVRPTPRAWAASSGRRQAAPVVRLQFSRSSCRPPRCRKIWGWGLSAPLSRLGFGQGGVPLLAVGDDVQEAAGVFHVVGVAGCDRFPGVAGRVGGGLAEGGQEPVLAVGPVIRERLTGPFAGDQDPASGVAEVLAAMGLALARPGSGRAGVLRLDAVAEPVRAPGEHGSYRNASASRSMWACCASLAPGGSQPPAW